MKWLKWAVISSVKMNLHHHAIVWQRVCSFVNNIRDGQFCNEHEIKWNDTERIVIVKITFLKRKSSYDELLLELERSYSWNFHCIFHHKHHFHCGICCHYQVWEEFSSIFSFNNFFLNLILMIIRMNLTIVHIILTYIGIPLLILKVNPSFT